MSYILNDDRTKRPVERVQFNGTESSISAGGKVIKKIYSSRVGIEVFDDLLAQYADAIGYISGNSVPLPVSIQSMGYVSSGTNQGRLEMTVIVGNPYSSAVTNVNINSTVLCALW